MEWSGFKSCSGSVHAGHMMDGYDNFRDDEMRVAKGVSCEVDTHVKGRQRGQAPSRSVDFFLAFSSTQTHTHPFSLSHNYSFTPMYIAHESLKSHKSRSKVPLFLAASFPVSAGSSPPLSPSSELPSAVKSFASSSSSLSQSLHYPPLPPPIFNSTQLPLYSVRSQRAYLRKPISHSRPQHCRARRV